MALASRRRRKQCLGELKARAAGELYALEMDWGKTKHVCMVLRTLRGMCLGGLREAEWKLLRRDAWSGARRAQRGSTARAIGGFLIN